MLKNFLSILYIYFLILVEHTRIKKFHYSGFLSKVFTKKNANKAIIVFLVGFISRIFINNFYNVNVFSDYLNTISFAYYSGMSLFIVFIHEVVIYFNLNVLPNFSFSSIEKIIVFIKKYFLSIVIFPKLPSIKLSNLSLFNITRATKSFMKNLLDSNSREKLTIGALTNGEDNTDFLKYTKIEVKDITNKAVLKNTADPESLVNNTYKPKGTNSSNTNNSDRGSNRLPRRINRGDHVRVVEADQTAISRPASIHTEFGFPATYRDINNSPVFFTIDTIRDIRGDIILSNTNPLVNYPYSSIYSQSLASNRAISHRTEGISQATEFRTEEVKDFNLYGDSLNSNFSTPDGMTPLFNIENKVNYGNIRIPPSEVLTSNYHNSLPYSQNNLTYSDNIVPSG